MTARHELDDSSTFSGVLTTVFRKPVPVTLLAQTPRRDFRLTVRLHQKVDPTPFVSIGQPSLAKVGSDRV